MKGYFLSFFFTLAIVLNVYSANTSIQGKIDGFNNKTLKVGSFSDYLTNEISWLASTQILNGQFKVDIPLNETTQLILKIEDKETSFFAEAGNVYNLKLTYDAAANRGRTFDKLLNLNFSFPKATELNQLIRQFNIAYQEFFSNNYKRMLIKGAVEETNEFIAEWKAKESHQQNDFVKGYVSYALANLEEINGQSKQILFDTYLQNQPILYGQKEYINFFTQYYQEDFQQLCLRNESRELRKAIMLEDDLPKCRKELMRLKKMQNETLAELYLLNGLYETYSSGIINQESVFSILGKIKQSGLSEENKAIASNMSTILKSQIIKIEVVDFELYNVHDQLVRLEDLQGKPVYLSFWSNTSIPSLRELRVMQKLADKYGEKIQFVSINIDEGKDIYKSIASKYEYDWNFLHYGNDYELIEKYGVKTVPAYFLIDDRGKMLRAFAEGPTEIERTFYNMVR